MTKKRVMDFLLSFVMVLSMSINLRVEGTIFFRNTNSVIFYLLIFVCLFKLLEKRNKKVKISFFILAIIMAILNVIAYYALQYDSMFKFFITKIQLFKSLVCVLGWTFIYYFLIEYLIDFMSSLKFKETKNKVVSFIFEKHPIISTFIILGICYVLVIILGYPGILNGDGMDEIKQYQHIYTWSLDYINLIDENVYINGHHSPFHTVIIGYIFSLFNSHQIGLLANVILQTVLQISIFAYMMNFFKKIKASYGFRIVVLLLCIFSPFINLSVINIYKDIPFALFTLLYTILLIEYFYLKEDNAFSLFKILITSLIIMLLTSKGIYVVLLTTIFILFKLIKRKTIFALFLIPIILCMGVNKILLPALHVTPGSVQEMLPLPIQQVSRYVKYYDNELTEEEKNVIRNVLEYDNIKTNYNPRIADPIKNHFNKNYTDEQVKDFIKLYVKLFFRHPGVYVSSFVSLYSGSWNFGYYNSISYFETSPYISHPDGMYSDLANTHGHALQLLQSVYLNARYIPIISLFVNLAVYFWTFVVLLVYLLVNKKCKYLLPLIPTLVVFLFLFVSPVGGNRRYFLPIIYTIPVLIAYVFSINQFSNKKS